MCESINVIKQVHSYLKILSRHCVFINLYKVISQCLHDYLNLLCFCFLLLNFKKLIEFHILFVNHPVYTKELIYNVNIV